MVVIVTVGKMYLEGWDYTPDDDKWHYFVERKSLCGVVTLLEHPYLGYDPGIYTAPGNCEKCENIINPRSDNETT